MASRSRTPAPDRLVPVPPPRKADDGWGTAQALHDAVAGAAVAVGAGALALGVGRAMPQLRAVIALACFVAIVGTVAVIARDHGRRALIGSLFGTVPAVLVAGAWLVAALRVLD